MLSENTNTELDESPLSNEDNIISSDIMQEQRQKRNFRKYSFIIAWVLSISFFGSVLFFSVKMMTQPERYFVSNINQQISKPDESIDKETNANSTNSSNQQTAKKDSVLEKIEENPINSGNQFLIILSLLSAIGTTLAISVMRFAFKDKEAKSNTDIVPVTPLANSISEIIKLLMETFSKGKDKE